MVRRVLFVLLILSIVLIAPVYSFAGNIPCPDINVTPGPGEAGTCFKYQQGPPPIWLVWCGHEEGEGQVDIEVDLGDCRNQPCEVIGITVTIFNDSGFYEVPQWYIWPQPTLFWDYSAEVDLENMICGINIITVCITYDCGGAVDTECEIIAIDNQIGCPPATQPDP